MAVLNVTPDSFADGGQHADPVRAVDDALAMEGAGADIIDIGGESTRPGAVPVSAEEELARVAPVLRGLAGRLRVPISIDTYKAAVAESALDLGAAIVNDISALTYDPALPGVVARTRAVVSLMHTRGRSRTMYHDAHYDDVVREVCAELGERLQRAGEAGIPMSHVLVDPGIGFAKRAEHSSTLLARLEAAARPRSAAPRRSLAKVVPAARHWRAGPSRARLGNRSRRHGSRAGRCARGSRARGARNGGRRARGRHAPARRLWSTRAARRREPRELVRRVLHA